jgi:DNA primase
MSQDWVEFAAVKAAVSLEMVFRLYRVDGLRSTRPGQLRGCCPMHRAGGDDAFHANLTKNAFQCFYCQAGGNVLDFVAAMEKCSIRQAALWLQRRFDVRGVPDWNGAGIEKRKLVPKKVEVNLPLRFRLQGVNPCHPYLGQRGITSATARYFGAGLFAGPGLMRGRIVIPIQDELGRTVAYAGRSLDGQAPRYKLPAGFRKSAVLFNLHRAAASGCDDAVVVEGFFDCMKVHQAGFASVVALMGTTLSAQQAMLLRARFGGLVLLLDGDAAGQRGANAIAAQLRDAGHVEVLELPAGAQPDQLSSREIRQLLGHRQAAYTRNLATLNLREIPISLENRSGQNASDRDAPDLQPTGDLGFADAGTSEASSGNNSAAEPVSQRKRTDLPKQAAAGYNKVCPE